MSLLSAVHLSKQFGDCISLTDVSLEFEPGQIHAVIGENGAGKSTLMKLLFGLHPPTSGHVELNEKKVEWSSTLDAIEHGLGMVQQHFALVETLSAIDNIMLGAEICSPFIGKLDRARAIQRMEELLPSPQLKVPWHIPVNQLSVGQKQRVEILKVLFKNAKILFLDEPTAVLTPFEVQDLFSVLKKLKSTGHTIVLITHKIKEVMDVCDTYAILRGGKLIARGNVRDTTPEKMIEGMIGRKILKIQDERMASRSEKVLSLEGIQSSNLQNVSLQVSAGEIVGIAGVEGSGQAALVNLLLGLSSFSGKAVLLNQDLSKLNTHEIRKLGLGLVPEDRSSQGLWLEESCFNNMIVGLESRFVKSEVIQRRVVRETTAKWADDFDVRSSSLEKNVGALSGGNQQKVIFAREVSGREPKFLLCHQPTRGVDLGAIDLIHRKLIELRNKGLGVLVLSSELDELFSLCDRIYVLFSGKVTGHFSRAEFDRLKVGAAMTGTVQ